MAMPKSVVKINKKDGVTFVSEVDKANYTISELSRAALRDVGRFVVREARQTARRDTGRMAKNIQYWNRKKEADLQIGYKPDGFYGAFYEVGTAKTPKEALLFNTVSQNLTKIIEIQSQYLSALEDEAAALALIDESEEEGPDD